MECHYVPGTVQGLEVSGEQGGGDLWALLFTTLRGRQRVNRKSRGWSSEEEQFKRCGKVWFFWNLVYRKSEPGGWVPSGRLSQAVAWIREGINSLARLIYALNLILLSGIPRESGEISFLPLIKSLSDGLLNNKPPSDDFWLKDKCFRPSWSPGNYVLDPQVWSLQITGMERQEEEWPKEKCMDFRARQTWLCWVSRLCDLE